MATEKKPVSGEQPDEQSILTQTVDMLKSEAKYIDKPAEEPKAEETEAGDKAE